MKVPDNIVFLGFTSCGKSSVGARVARKLRYRFIDLDHEIQVLATKHFGKERTCREIFQQEGASVFRELELQCLEEFASQRGVVLSPGGGIVELEESRSALRKANYIVYLKALPETLLERMMYKKGVPAFLKDDPSVENLASHLAKREASYEELADLVLQTDGLKLFDVVDMVIENLK
ncbi:MAG: shikimate kinase [Lentisphaeria bacterium]|nr:shikimate kinase [Lentisphaeria bacterium]